MMLRGLDESLMRRAIALAEGACGTTAPNPPVGCVIARSGLVVGEGATASGGRPHAEAVALARAGAEARGATVYVTLEPCAHHGRTPPCADALVAAAVGRVVVALAHDPDPRVAGAGVRRLREAGLQVDLGLLAEEARGALAGFLKRHAAGRPYVTARLRESDAAAILAAGAARERGTPLADELVLRDGGAGRTDGGVRVVLAFGGARAEARLEGEAAALVAPLANAAYRAPAELLQALGAQGVNRLGLELAPERLAAFAAGALIDRVRTLPEIGAREPLAAAVAAQGPVAEPWR